MAENLDFKKREIVGEKADVKMSPAMRKELADSGLDKMVSDNKKDECVEAAYGLISRNESFRAIFEKAIKHYRIGGKLDSPKFYSSLKSILGNGNGFFALSDQAKLELRFYFPKFKFLEDVDMGNGPKQFESLFLENRARVHNNLAGILYWHICRHDHAGQWFPHWNNQDKNRLAVLIFRLGTRESVDLFAGHNGAVSYDDLKQRLGINNKGQKVPKKVLQGPSKTPQFMMTARDEKRFASYAEQYSAKNHDHNILNRTYEGRLKDHEFFLEDLFGSGKSHFPGRMEVVRKMAFPTAIYKPLFIDIGPGIANKDLNIAGGRGKPAVTLQEMAGRFKQMPCFILDLPDEVSIFTGKTPESVAGYKISAKDREDLLAKQNVHIISGDGYKSLKLQMEDKSNNPFPNRERPKITSKSTVVVRIANSIDIYGNWEKQTKPTLLRMAVDFRDNPLVLFFNREILVKEAGSVKLQLVGRVSDNGFNHQKRPRTKDRSKAYKLWKLGWKK